MVRILKDRGIRAVEAGSGGVFAALFRLSKEDRVGFTVDMKAIPILQQTVEILSFLGGNPYRLYSRGTVIASVPTEEVSEVLRALEDAGVSAGIIGRTEKGVKKILLRGDEVRYLERTSETFVLDKESGI